MMNRSSPHSSQAFSLTELLIVMAIVGLLASLTMPAFSSIVSGNGISKGGQILGDQIIFARQEATTKNRNVELRFISMPNGLLSGYSAMQLWMTDETGTNSTPLGKLQKLPEGVLIASNDVLSPLLKADSSVGGVMTILSQSTAQHYVGFLIRSSGALSSAITTDNNFLTIVAARDADKTPPKNYYAVQVNPVTGRVTIQRP